MNHTHNFPANFITFCWNEFSYEKSYEFHRWVLVKRSPDLMFSSLILIPLFSLVPKAGNSPLHFASKEGHAGVAAKLIDAKADVNSRDQVISAHCLRIVLLLFIKYALEYRRQEVPLFDVMVYCSKSLNAAITSHPLVQGVLREYSAAWILITTSGKLKQI